MIMMIIMNQKRNIYRIPKKKVINRKSSKIKNQKILNKLIIQIALIMML